MYDKLLWCSSSWVPADNPGRVWKKMRKCETPFKANHLFLCSAKILDSDCRGHAREKGPV